MKDSELTHLIIGAAIEIHRNLGPGLLEAVYEECLARELTLLDLPFERQKPIPLVYKDLKLECGYRLDFLVAGRVVVEIKSIEALAPIHESVMLTYFAYLVVRWACLLTSMCPFSKMVSVVLFGTIRKKTTRRRRVTQRLAEKKNQPPQRGLP